MKSLVPRIRVFSGTFGGLTIPFSILNIEETPLNSPSPKKLSPEEHHVLKESGTERPGTSPLNDEHRKGLYVCAACELPLFTSEMKFNSGTGWPSFFDVIQGNIETKKDYSLIIPRTEYHCAQCKGHQGHLFKDGPPPTGLRYCNNGIALKFIPENSD